EARRRPPLGMRPPTRRFLREPEVDGTVRYPVRRTRAAGVRAAMRPGIAATRLASTTAPAATRAIEPAGTLGAGTTWMLSANRSHRARPRAMPSGTPTTVPIATTALDCQATTAAS